VIGSDCTSIRPWLFGEQERRLLNLEQITGALHDQVEGHIQRHPLRDRRADAIKLIATEWRTWCSDHVDLFLPVSRAGVSDPMPYDLEG
jgi:hypothetical protein